MIKSVHHFCGRRCKKTSDEAIVQIETMAKCLFVFVCFCLVLFENFVVKNVDSSPPPPKTYLSKTRLSLALRCVRSYLHATPPRRSPPHMHHGGAAGGGGHPYAMSPKLVEELSDGAQVR